jgi:hypothetical protein
VELNDKADWFNFTAELFVTEVADNEEASLPPMSWTALASFAALGSVYETVTVSVILIIGEIVKVTLLELIVTSEIVAFRPPTETEKVEELAVVEERFSL